MKRKQNWLRRWYRRLVKRLDLDTREVFVLCGLTIGSVGLFYVQWQIGVIVFGLGLFLIGYFGIPDLHTDEQPINEEKLAGEIVSQLRKARRA